MHTENIKKHLGDLFETDDALFIDNFLESTDLMEFNTGDYVLHQGSHEKLMYIVISGRLRIIREDGKGIKILGDVAVGQPVGEFSFFSDEPRIASAIAMRSTKLLRLSEDQYLDLIKSYPIVSQKFSSFVYKRLKSNHILENENSAPKNISIILLNPEENIKLLINEILEELERTNIIPRVYFQEDYVGENVNQILKNIDEHEGVNFLICDKNNPEWSAHCLTHSDSIILATDFNADKKLYSIEKELHLYSKNILNQKKYLLLIHKDGSIVPLNTSDWLEPRNIDLHIHFRIGNDQDLRRFCRIITHRATGLVLGGGGAKGFAHIGAVKALKEKGIEIDFVGGTSAGALYGIGMAFLDFEFDKSLEMSKLSNKMKALSTKFTLPIISILSSIRITNFLKAVLGSMCLEDIWINSYCVSTNYSDSKLAIHQSGCAWKKISASIALPGIFPPVILDNKIHIDGGVMDNLPIEFMYSYPVSQVIAVALSPIENQPLVHGDLPSSWSLLRDKFRKSKKYDLPSIPSLLVSAGLINSTQRQISTNSGVDMYIELNLKGIKMLDGKKWKEMIQMGYEQMNEYLDKKKS